MCFCYAKTTCQGWTPGPPHYATEPPLPKRQGAPSRRLGLARPRLGAEERRTRTIGVRVTEAQAAELAELAQAARLSVAALHASACTGAAGAHRGRAPPRRGRDLRELNRIGVNLNQMARVLNSGAARAPAETRAAVERVGELVAALLAGEAD